MYVLKIFLIVYIISMILCVLFKNKILEDLDEDGIFSNDYVLSIVSYVPIMNTLLLFFTLKDYLMEKYLIWKCKKILRSIVHKLDDDKELQNEIK